MTDRPQYDLPTAITFLIIGLAVGSILTVLFAPLPEESRKTRPLAAGAARG